MRSLQRALKFLTRAVSAAPIAARIAATALVVAIASGAPVSSALAQSNANATASRARLSAADRALLDRASAYLTNLSGANGRFVQTDPSGRQIAGEYWIKRPGKIRFEYDRTGLLVVSDGTNVNVYDPRLKTFDRFPLAATPLNLFLARQVRVDRGVQVDSVRRARDGFVIVARDPRRQAEGSIALIFNEANGALRLREWTITDGQGRRTRVQLTSLQTASPDPALFVLNAPAGTRR